MKNIKINYLFVLMIVIGFLFSARLANAQDSYDKTKKAIADMYDYLNKQDITKAMELIDSKAVDHTPYPGQRQGPEGFRDIINILFKAFPDFSQEIVDVIISPDGTKSCILVKMKGTHKGEFMGMPATGKKIDVLASDIIYFKDGKATEHWGFIDSETMMKQLGMMK